MKLASMKIGTRLGLGFGVVVLFTGIIGASSFWSVHHIGDTAIKEFRGMLQGDAAIAEHSARARANVLGLRRFEKDIFLNLGSKEKEEEYFKKWNEQRERLLTRLDNLEKAAYQQQDKDSVQTMRTEMAHYQQGFEKVYDSVRSGRIKTAQEANTAIDEYKESIHSLEAAAQAFSNDGNKRMAGVEALIDSLANRTSFIMTILTAISVILGVVFSILIALSITRPLKKVIASLNDGAEQVAAASGQVSSASQQLAEGASQQAASLEETSSSLEQMTSMTRQNAENAGQANSLMDEAGRTVAQGGRSMTELARSMKEISAASEETVKIVKTIDEIAFQTNLLALNAAVEAARAGEAGAGFAVVADEVRNLAIRAADAAKNTANLIEGTVTRIKEGVELADKTAEDFSEMSGSAGKVKELISEIAAATKEQAQGVEQIARGVAEMDKVVQQNAANAEESASASEELSGQAEHMKGSVLDLVAMVGGHGSNAAVLRERGLERIGQRGEARLVQGFQQRTGKKKQAVIRQKGNGGRLPAPVQTAPKGKASAPEEVIPFDDDDVQDF